jgi:hypothetical protein
MHKSMSTCSHEHAAALIIHRFVWYSIGISGKDQTTIMKHSSSKLDFTGNWMFNVLESQLLETLNPKHFFRISSSHWLSSIKLQFRLAYESNNGELVFNRRDIAVRYVCGHAFILDVITVLPLPQVTCSHCFSDTCCFVWLCHPQKQTSSRQRKKDSSGKQAYTCFLCALPLSSYLQSVVMEFFSAIY